MKARLARFALLALVATLLLAACDGAGPASEATPAASPTPSAVAPAGSPTAGAAGDVQDCGAEVLPQGATSVDQAARDCLWQAYQAGTPAVFTSTAPTIEGDPITMRLEVLGADDLLVSVDNSQDRFASPADRGVQNYRCTTVTVTTLSPGQPPRFEVSGCPDGAAFLV